MNRLWLNLFINPLTSIDLLNSSGQHELKKLNRAAYGTEI